MGRTTECIPLSSAWRSRDHCFDDVSPRARAYASQVLQVLTPH